MTLHDQTSPAEGAQRSGIAAPMSTMQLKPVPSRDAPHFLANSATSVPLSVSSRPRLTSALP